MEATLYAFDNRVPTEQYADDGDEPDPQQGLRRVALGGIPGFYFLE